MSWFALLGLGIVTPKKFVRKPKGLAEGQVLVEKENVVMVVPKGE